MYKQSHRTVNTSNLRVRWTRLELVKMGPKMDKIVSQNEDGRDSFEKKLSVQKNNKKWLAKSLANFFEKADFLDYLLDDESKKYDAVTPEVASSSLVHPAETHQSSDWWVLFLSETPRQTRSTRTSINNNKTEVFSLLENIQKGWLAKQSLAKWLAKTSQMETR